MSDLDVVLATVIQCIQEDVAEHHHVNNYYPAAFHVQKSAKFPTLDTLCRAGLGWAVCTWLTHKERASMTTTPSQ